MSTDYRAAIQTYIAGAEQEIGEMQRELARIPKGWLQLDNKSSGCYLQVTELNGEKRSVNEGNSSGIARVLEIQRRALTEKVLARMQNNVKWAKKALEKYRETEPTKVLRTLSAAYRTIPEKWGESVRWLEHPDTAAWIERNNRRNPSHPENLIHLSSFGQFYRSKSELAIAEMLHNEGLPFRYEPELWLQTEYGETVRYPDFEILLDDGRSLYLEHLGLLNYEEYAKNVSEKLSLYYSNGICLGHNLLLTVDAPDGSINLSMIRAMVNAARNFRPAEY